MNRSYSSGTKLNFSCDTLPNIRSHTKFGSSDFKAKTEKTGRPDDTPRTDVQQLNETDSEEDDGPTNKMKGTNETSHFSNQIGHLDDSISKSIHIFLPDIHRKTQGQTFINHLNAPNK